MQFYYRVGAVLWSLALLVLSSMPGKYFPQFSLADLLTIDKLVHAVLYGVFTWLLFESQTTRSKRSLWLAAVTSFTFGYAMELAQKFLFTDRAYELPDQVANTFGVLVVVWIIYRWLLPTGAVVE